jgi:tRNA(Glu) U13 pseudouridine synthase TruD
VRPGDLSLDAHEDGFILRFSLPAGSYATVVLREIFKQDAIAFDRR